MNDGSQQGIGAERALDTLLGGKPPPSKEEEKTPAFWLKRLLAKDDDINGYEAHAEVMAKYIVLAYQRMPELTVVSNQALYLRGEDGETDYAVEVLPNLSGVLKRVYAPEHPFCLAVAQATGFTWGWAYNIARFAVGLPPRPNPALLTISVSKDPK